MSHPFLRECNVAEAAVLQAAKLTKKVLLASSIQQLSKDDATPVTVADFAAQALMISAVRREFPDDGFVGEEGADALREDRTLRERVYELFSSPEFQGRGDDGLVGAAVSMDEMLGLIDVGGRGRGGESGRFWAMDPVDGTATFLRGEQYAVSLALIEDGKEMVGVLACPNLKVKDGRVHESSVDKEGMGIMLTAVRGQGSTTRSLSLHDNLLPHPHHLPHLKAPTNLADLHVVQCERSKSLRNDIIKQMAGKLGAQYPGTDLWSSHMRYVALVLGGADYQVRVPVRADYQSLIWDHAGAQLIYTEAGGRITDLDGKAIYFGAGRDLNRNRGMVAATERIHDTILGLVKDLVDKE